MSLINRVALCNFSNIEGEDSDIWNPRFRYEVLDFHGQSAIVNLLNGGGKTTMARAVIGLLSLQPTLLSQTKQHASSRRLGYWSHIQVELIEPQGDGLQQDMMVRAGAPLSGETWVFGMVLHRDSDQKEFYYYPGRLEDLLPAERVDRKLKFRRNEEFRTLSKQIIGIEWAPSRESWRATLNQHIPSEVLKGLAEFQKEGGADKDAPIFKLANMKKGQGRLDQRFFYEVLAPELLADVLDTDDSEDAGKIDEQLYRVISDLVNTQHRLQAHQEKVSNMRYAMDYLSEAAELGSVAMKASSDYDAARKGLALDLAVLNDLVIKRPVPGVPKCNLLPEGAIGEVATHLVIIPGEIEPRITNKGLATVLGIPTGVLTDAAKRKSILGNPATQVVEIPCVFKTKDKHFHGGSRHSGVCYTIKQATEILTTHKKGGEDARELFEDAVAWFDKHGETNPFRMDLLEMLDEDNEAQKTNLEARNTIDQLQEESIELQETLKKVEANQDAFDRLKGSGCFSKQELDAPSITASLVEQEKSDADEAKRDFEGKQIRLQEYQLPWNSFISRFDDEVPAEVDARLSNAHQEAREALGKNEIEERKADAELKKCNRKIGDQKDKLTRLETQYEQVNTHKLNGRLILENLVEGKSPIGLEDRRREDLTQAELNLSKCNQAIKVARDGVAAIEEFRKLVPGQNAADWIKEANSRRLKLTLEQQEHSILFRELTRQRKALDVDPVAAGAISQQALDVLDAENIEYLELHKYLMTLNLEHERRGDLLTMFSALMFAPVVDLQNDAIRAVNILEDSEIPIPVFNAAQLEGFCRGTDWIKSGIENVSGLIVGHLNRQVKCILDPELVIREKESLDIKITDTKAQLSNIKSELVNLDPEGVLANAARAAESAIVSGAPERLQALESKVETIKSQVAKCKDVLSKEMISAMRAAESFEKAGGKSGLSELISKVEEVRENALQAERDYKDIESFIEKLRILRQTLTQAAEQAYPDEIRKVVTGASRFVALGGPAFRETEEETEGQMIKALETAEKRHAFQWAFSSAQQWLDYQNELESGDDVNVQIEANKTEVTLARKRISEAEERIKDLKEHIPRLRERVKSIDHSAIALISKYKRIAVLSGDFWDNTINETAIDAHPLGEAAWSLRETIDKVSDNIQDAAEFLADAVAGYNIDAELEKAKSQLRDRDKAVKAFLEKTQEASKLNKGLSPVERERLSGVNSLEDADMVNNFANEFWEHFSKEEDILGKLSSDELTVSSKFTERLALLLESAEDNLSTLKKIAKANPSNMQSHFIVKAKVARREDLSGVIDGIVDLVDTHERRRREDEDKGRPVASTKKDQASLQADIKERLYQSVFTDATVKYVNEQIRPNDDAHRLSESLSTGQKNALLMMWVLRLALYRIEREARRLPTGISRRRIRNRGQSIMIIDGLFSNLSDPKLIRSVLGSLPNTRGGFQLIGLVHDADYRHDFELFPVFILGNNQDKKRWVSFDCVDEEGALVMARLARRADGGIS